MAVPKMARVAADDVRLPAGPQAELGILAFEAAATMSTLLSLHRSLSPAEMARLRSDAMRSAGVAYLTSTDQAFLLRLACAEVAAPLDAAAAAVSRLGLRCGIDFAAPYATLKAGAPDARLRLEPLVGGRRLLKVETKKMGRLVAATARLCGEMEALDELETAERKLVLRGCGRLSGPIPATASYTAAASCSGELHQDLKAQHARVRRLKEESLWSQSYEKAVGLMARAACAVFVRVCVVFGAFVPGLPPPLRRPAGTARSRFSKLLVLRPRPAAQRRSSSGPIVHHRDVPLRMGTGSNSCPIIRPGWEQPCQPTTTTEWRKLLEPPASTVGGAGLDLQYANVIATAERLLLLEADAGEREEEGRSERVEMYAMLPSRLRAAIRTKLRGWWREREEGPRGAAAQAPDAEMAEGWRSAAGRILAWLAPMARETARWHAERGMDRQRRFEGGVRAWSLQTLRWADAEKAEAAVVEVLVALSCVCWYEERRRGSRRRRGAEPPNRPQLR